MLDENQTEKTGPVRKRARRRFGTLKIRRALMAELEATGMGLAEFLLLRPSEVAARLGARMKAMHFKDHEIPSARVFAAYFKSIPLEQAES